MSATPRRPLAPDALRGALAGVGATVAMTGLMALAGRLGLMGRMPPERITERGLRRLGLRPGRRRLDLMAAVMHLGFGGGAGMVYAGASPRLPRRPPAILSGILFATGIWIVSYMGWAPALGLMPPAQRDRPGRPQSMLAAHWVYGAVLAGLLRKTGR